MLAGTDALVTIANHWLARFEAALRGRDDAALRSLFHTDSHWRDLLALTWRIRTVSGLDALLDALERKGFKLDYGDDFTGWPFKYLTRGGGYYFNVGCSDLIVENKIALAQYPQLDGLLGQADLVVLATGWEGQEALVGEAMAKRVGPIWGFGEGQELRNMLTRTPQPGLWFIAGSFAQCRIYSKYLALQIKASELGLL